MARDKGDFDRCFRALLGENEFSYLSFDVEAGELPDSVEAADDGWLITGSRHGAYEDHPWRDPLEDFIRAARAAARPVVGICFGHQIVARALGGEVKPADIGWIAGPQTYRGPYEHIFTVNALHHDQVTRPPEGVEVIVTSENCAVAGLYEPGKVLIFQPHPEFDSDFMERLFKVRSNLLPEEMLNTIPATASAKRCSIAPMSPISCARS
ncbi:type 1 glutamine amidotransferase [Breoghania sp.]|uniref:type 1 glutamine amidotransferase n=1 Tax=Breoghania sp. TaxID=2065378 RepID=UPI002619B9FE|nr:type 1 glutamine amidotransferase [Breoghania sp.]MDJ0933278.1 type 1 glutamine amidotransferase [Breoghania sp.]